MDMNRINFSRRVPNLFAFGIIALFCVIIFLVFYRAYHKIELIDFSNSYYLQKESYVLPLNDISFVNQKSLDEGSQDHQGDNFDNPLSGTSLGNQEDQPASEPQTVQKESDDPLPESVLGQQDRQKKDNGSTKKSATVQPQSVNNPVHTPEKEDDEIENAVQLIVQLPNETIDQKLTIVAGDDDVCEILQKAETLGIIQSLTLDNSYLASTKSLYVKEINSYTDMWTFKVNDVSPLGCSLSFPVVGDVILWKYVG